MIFAQSHRFSLILGASRLTGVEELLAEGLTRYAGLTPAEAADLACARVRASLSDQVASSHGACAQEVSAPLPLEGVALDDAEHVALVLQLSRLSGEAVVQVMRVAEADALDASPGVSRVSASRVPAAVRFALIEAILRKSQVSAQLDPDPAA